MNRWRKPLLLAFGFALAIYASHQALGTRSIPMLVVQSDGKDVEAFRIDLTLDGKEPRVVPIPLDPAGRQLALAACARADRRSLSDLARSRGDFRFSAALSGLREGWPWWLGGDPRREAVVTDVGWIERRLLSWFTGPVPPALFENPRDAGTSRDSSPADPLPEDRVESQPPGRSTVTPSPRTGVVKVEILNDCGIKGAADLVARAVRRPGVEIIFVGNTTRFRYRPTGVQSSVGVPVVLQEILEEMGIPESAVERTPAGRRKAEVTFIVGRDYRKVLERKNARTPE